MKTATSTTKKAPASGGSKPAPVLKQPQSKTKAAASSRMFLHADDQWSLAYFNSGDLHCEERELFG